MNLRRCFLLLFLLLVAEEGARAQTRTSLFSAPVTISTGLENVPGPDGALVPESSLLVKPVHPLFAKDTPRTTLRLSYAPEFEFVRNGGNNLTFWNHAADFAYGHTTGPRTRFTIGHSFVRTSDPLRLFQDSLFVLSRNNFRQNSTVVAARHDLTRRTSIGTRFDNTITRISSADRLDGTYLNGYGLAGTLSLTRHLTQRQKFTGSYSMLKFSPYQFPGNVDPDIFLSTLPTVRAGISRFALTIGLSSAEAATTPSGMLGGSRIGNPAGAPGTPAAPASPGFGAPVIGPIAAIDSWDASGPVTEGLSSSPQAISRGNRIPTGPLVGVVIPRLPAATPASSHAASPQTPFIFAATEDSGDPSPPTAEPALKPMKLLGDPFHVAVGTYTYQSGPGLIFEISGGAMTDRDVSYLMGAQIEKSSDRLWMSLGFHHFLSLYGRMPVRGIPTTFSSMQPPDTRARSEYSAATLTIDGKLTRNTELGVSASVSRSTANFVEHHIRSLVGSARINHWLTDRWGIFATVDSVSEDRVQAGASAFNRQRYFGGIQIRMSPPRSIRVSER